MLELNGDDKLSYKEKILYISYNLRRNFIGESKVSKTPYFYRNSELASDIASPGRALADEFIAYKLHQLVGSSIERVLDVGCGSGRSSELLKNIQSLTNYIGIDAMDRFKYNKNTRFDKEFIVMDIKNYNPKQEFDLIMSISALEHIQFDEEIIKNLIKITKKGGFQVHIVPAGAALFAYLWHGYRQYTLSAITQRFGTKNLVLYELGGLGSLFIHIIWITFPENIFKFNARLKFKAIYKICRSLGFWFDKILPFCPLLYVIFLENKGL